MNNYKTLVSELDKQIAKIRDRTADTEELLVEMLEHMPKIKPMLTELTNDELDKLCEDNLNFHYYMQLLTGIAEGLSSGEISPPK